MSTASDEKEIRALIDRWVEHACNGNIDGVMACYASDVVAYDAIVALQFKGADAYRKHWEYCMSFIGAGDMIMKIPEMSVTAGDDIAFCHYLSLCGCKDQEGKEQTGWMRGTVCLRKIDGRWLIVHEHYSSPFDPESMKVLTELDS